MNKRILLSLGGVLTDISNALNRYDLTTSKTVPLIQSSGDCLYIGSRLPFNHAYLKLATPNATPVQMSVKYFSNQWENMVELNDETNGLARSGFITFVPSRNALWAMQSVSSEVTGLENTEIYDLYWLKISFSADLDALTALCWVGEMFADDIDLGAEFPDLLKSSVMTAYKAGKTNWEEQHVRAAEILIADLIAKNIIDDSAQILVRDDYKNAALCKVAEIVYSAFGDDYLDQRKSALAEYEKRMNKRIHRIDVNASGKEEVAERKSTTGWLSR